MDYQTQSNMPTGNAVPKIRFFETTERFKFLWLKYVRDFDLTNHCARCLVGDYSSCFSYRSNLSKQLIDVALDEAKAKYYYLCGVTTPYRYDDNLHLAFRYFPGKNIEYNDGKTTIIIEDAERIEIVKRQEYHNEFNGSKREFNTCRNWQFAYQMTYPE